MFTATAGGSKSSSKIQATLDRSGSLPGVVVRAHAGIVVDALEREVVFGDESSVVLHSEVPKRHTVHRSCDARIIGAFDLGSCEQERCTRLEDT